MKSPTILVALLAICALWITPSTVDASEGYIIDDTTAVFFITFTMDAAYGQFEVPVIADHTVDYTDRVDVAGYQLAASDEDTPTISTVSELILSSAPLNGTRYEVATGTEATFTLMSVVTFSDPIDTNLQATLTKLPFWVDGRRTSVHERQLADIAPAIARQ